MTSLDNFFSESINKRKEEGLFRELRTHTAIDFSSNDYLGLARSQELTKLIHEMGTSLNLQNGATGSRLLSGNSKHTEETEEKLSHIFRSESALIFNSGYTANLAVLSAIPQKGDTIIYDELVHASIKDGARLSLATRYSFKHNDLNDLEAKIKRTTGRIFIVVESIYSMDGDECPLEDLVPLAEKYDACIVLDEAHSTGSYGPSGSGLSVALSLHERIGIRVYTFGKAMGIHGACVAGSDKLISYLINFARPFIYTTALPPHSIASIECAFVYLSQHMQLQKELKKNIELFLTNTEGVTNRTKSKSAIQTIIFPGNKTIKLAANSLMQDGFDIRPILSPTIPKGTERLRICLHSHNTEEQILSLCKALSNLEAKISPIHFSARRSIIS